MTIIWIRAKSYYHYIATFHKISSKKYQSPETYNYITTRNKNLQLPVILKRFEEFGLVEKSPLGAYRMIEPTDAPARRPACCDCTDCTGNCGYCPKTRASRASRARAGSKKRKRGGHICGCARRRISKKSK